jgi:hypothetical protein
MFWFIIGIIRGVAFVVSALVLAFVYLYAKAAEKACKDGWDMPN